MGIIQISKAKKFLGEVTRQFLHGFKYILEIIKGRA